MLDLMEMATACEGAADSLAREREPRKQWHVNMRAVLLSVTLVIIANGGAATAKPTKATLIGAGGKTCAQFADEYKRSPGTGPLRKGRLVIR
jgi:hypothetical protein